MTSVDSPGLWRELVIGLWRGLEVASIDPEEANFQDLWDLLEEAIDLVPESLRLVVAGEAILQMSQILLSRSDLITALLEQKSLDIHEEPMTADFLADFLIRQSTNIDFDGFIQPQEKYKRVKPPKRSPQDSIAGAVNKENLLAVLHQALDVAHSEDMGLWSSQIETWFHQHSGEQRVSLKNLQEPLALTSVEIWLGMLLCPHLFLYESCDGEFYASDVWISRRQT